MTTFATIVGPSGFRYTLTANDVLWAARMADGEGDADVRQVLWTMTQRFAGIVRQGSFTEFIRAYSQPINPKWQRDGICCAQGATGCPARPSRSFYGEEPCSPARLDRRDRMASMPWDSIPVAVRSAVWAWATASMPNPVSEAVDFAAPDLVQRKLARNPDLRLVYRGRNWFISTGESRRLGKNAVTMHYQGKVAQAAAGGGLLLVGAAAAAVGVWWWRRRRHAPA